MFDLLGGLLVMLLAPKLLLFLLKLLFYTAVVVPLQLLEFVWWLLQLCVYGIGLLQWNLCDKKEEEKPKFPELHLTLWDYWER